MSKAMILLVLLACASSYGAVQSPKEPGDVWLSSSPESRSNLVIGYIVGYRSSINENCYAFTRLLSDSETKVLQARHRESVTAICVAKAKTFGAFKPQLGAAGCCNTYASVITKFYEHYPIYRGTEPIEILRRLYDGGDRNETDVYRDALAGKFRVVE